MLKTLLFSAASNQAQHTAQASLFPRELFDTPAANQPNSKASDYMLKREARGGDGHNTGNCGTADTSGNSGDFGTPSNPKKPDSNGPHGPKKKRRKYRTVFVSDVHLGTRASRADLLLDFLKSLECEHLYLVGDIIDGWRLKKSWYWDSTHNDVIRRLLKMSHMGTRVTYIPGNHDEGFRGFTGIDLAGIELRSEAIHTAADGRRFWVIHGDEFDGVVKYAKWLAHIGDTAYGLLLRLNTAFNHVRRSLGFSYWSLSAYIKHKVKNAVEYIGKFEEAVAHEAQRRGVDGVICGHIHHAECRTIGDTIYMNDGDWVESCTALVEDAHGQFSIVYYAQERAQQDAAKAAARTEEALAASNGTAAKPKSRKQRIKALLSRAKKPVGQTTASAQIRPDTTSDTGTNAGIQLDTHAEDSPLPAE